MTIDIHAFDRELEERLLRYVRIDTQSDEHSASMPSTAIQLDLLHLLQQELTEIGASDVRITEYGAVLATIPATVEGDLPTVGFLGHVDTTAAFNGYGVKPIVHRAWNGEPIVLPDDPARVISPEEFPYLGTKVGEDIVTASGTTLLGADDKAGVAIVMAMTRHLLAHPEIPHGPIRIAFTPDEEIGRGVDKRLPADLGAEVAYTLDGAELGEIAWETFSGDKAEVTITGVSTHPGDAYGEMVNALTLAAQIVTTLPIDAQTPETTKEREGFIHLYQIEGTAAEAKLHFILRDFTREGLAGLGSQVQEACAAVQASAPRASIACTIAPQYRNMAYWLENDMRPVDLARQAIRDLGFEPFSAPVRGGTDGSRLTEMGVPCPNLFTGMQQIHGPLEWISVQDMSRATAVCIQLATWWAKGG